MREKEFDEKDWEMKITMQEEERGNRYVQSLDESENRFVKNYSDDNESDAEDKMLKRDFLLSDSSSSYSCFERKKTMEMKELENKKETKHHLLM